MVGLVETDVLGGAKGFEVPVLGMTGVTKGTPILGDTVGFLVIAVLGETDELVILVLGLCEGLV